MKRKAIFALAVAVAMLVAVIPVSAGSSYDYGTYGSYTAKVSGDIYRYSDSSIPYTTIGPESNKSSIYLDTTFKFDPLYIVSHHYINNINIDNLYAAIVNYNCPSYKSSVRGSYILS